MDGKYKLYRDDRFYNTSEDPKEKNVIIDPTLEEQKIRTRFRSILRNKEKEFPFSWNDESFKKDKINKKP
jgi:arylsulfatase A